MGRSIPSPCCTVIGRYSRGQRDFHFFNIAVCHSFSICILAYYCIKSTIRIGIASELALCAGLTEPWWRGGRNSSSWATHSLTRQPGQLFCTGSSCLYSIQLNSERKLCCGSGMFIPDPHFSIADPGSKRFRIGIKELKFF
jgi:hypothetical protein